MKYFKVAAMDEQQIFEKALKKAKTQEEITAAGMLIPQLKNSFTEQQKILEKDLGLNIPDENTKDG